MTQLLVSADHAPTGPRTLYGASRHIGDGTHYGKWVSDPTPPQPGDVVCNGTMLEKTTLIPIFRGVIFESAFELPASPAYRALSDERTVGTDETYGVRYSVRRTPYVTTSPEFERGLRDGAPGGKFAPPESLDQAQRWAYFNGFVWGRKGESLSHWDSVGTWAGRAGIGETVEEACFLLGVHEDGKKEEQFRNGAPQGTRSAFVNGFLHGRTWRTAVTLFAAKVRGGAAPDNATAAEAVSEAGYLGSDRSAESLLAEAQKHRLLPVA